MLSICRRALDAYHGRVSSESSFWTFWGYTYDRLAATGRTGSTADRFRKSLTTNYTRHGVKHFLLGLEGHIDLTQAEAELILCWLLLDRHHCYLHCFCRFEGPIF